MHVCNICFKDQYDIKLFIICILRVDLALFLKSTFNIKNTFKDK